MTELGNPSTPEEVPPSTTPNPQFIDIPGIGQVSLDEAAKGYLRQSDYTKKTQEVASEREELTLAKQLVEALDADPEATIESLIREYGVEVGPKVATPEAEGSDPVVTSVENPALPQEVQDKLAKVDEVISRYEQEQWEQRIDREVAQVVDEFKGYGVEVDRVELINYAVQNGIPDLSAAAKAMTWDSQRNAGRNEGVRTADSRREATVEGASQGSGSEPEVDSFEDAFAKAKRATLSRFTGR